MFIMSKIQPRLGLFRQKDIMSRMNRSSRAKHDIILCGLLSCVVYSVEQPMLRARLPYAQITIQKNAFFLLFALSFLFRTLFWLKIWQRIKKTLPLLSFIGILYLFG